MTNTLFLEDLSDVVLTGHSYVGMIITGVAAKEPKRLGPIAQWIKPFADRSRELGWNVYTLTAGHCAQVTYPKELADILLKIAGN